MVTTLTVLGTNSKQWDCTSKLQRVGRASGLMIHQNNSRFCILHHSSYFCLFEEGWLKNGWIVKGINQKAWCLLGDWLYSVSAIFCIMDEYTSPSTSVNITVLTQDSLFAATWLSPPSLLQQNTHTDHFSAVVPVRLGPKSKASAAQVASRSPANLSPLDHTAAFHIICVPFPFKKLLPSCLDSCSN